MQVTCSGSPAIVVTVREKPGEAGLVRIEFLRPSDNSSDRGVKILICDECRLHVQNDIVDLGVGQYRSAGRHRTIFDATFDQFAQWTGRINEVDVGRC